MKLVYLLRGKQFDLYTKLKIGVSQTFHKPKKHNFTFSYFSDKFRNLKLCQPTVSAIRIPDIFLL